MNEQNKSSLPEAMDRLNEQNRILLEARMLPPNKPLTAEHTYSIIERFNEYIAERGIKPARVSREIKYSESTLSQWRANVYKGDIDAVTRAVNNWMERDARRAEADKPKDYVKTWVAETMRTMCYQADKRGKMLVIIAPSGTGKTKVLQAIAEEMRGIYIQADDGKRAPKELIRCLCAAVKGKTTGTIGVMLASLIEQLRKQPRIIIIDECQFLARCLSVIRSVYDQAGVPVIMAGTSDILPYVDDRTDGRGQFASRTLFCNIMDAIVDVERDGGGDKSESRDLFSLEEIAAFFETKKIRLTREALMFAWSLACLPNYGTLRFAFDVAAMAEEWAKKDPVDRKHMMNALQLCLGRPLAKHVKTIAQRHEEFSRTAAG